MTEIKNQWMRLRIYTKEATIIVYKRDLEIILNRFFTIKALID